MALEIHLNLLSAAPRSHSESPSGCQGENVKKVLLEKDLTGFFDILDQVNKRFGPGDFVMAAACFIR